MDETRLFELKQEIDEAKEEVGELKGKKKLLLEQLKEQWGCASIDQAAKKMEEFSKQIQKLETSIETGLKELEEKYADE
jgi:septal ring factor EnvC (AmiA/AmiB activator)